MEDNSIRINKRFLLGYIHVYIIVLPECNFYLTDYYWQHAALIITDSAQLLGLTIGKKCQNYIILVSDVFHIPTCTTSMWQNSSYLSTAIMLTLQTVYVQKMGNDPFSC